MFIKSLSLALFLISFNAQARDSELQSYLREFHGDPAGKMEQRLVKKDNRGRQVREIETRFSREDIATRAFIEKRDGLRSQMCTFRDGQQLCLKDWYTRGRAAIGSNDLPENLVDNSNIVKNINAMDQQGLKQSVLPVKPWSDSYWPMVQGIIGNRYADRHFPKSLAFPINYNYFLANSPSNIVQSRSNEDIQDLSPAEKYDYMVGDTNWSLTRSVWAQGKAFQDRYGTVESWTGICNGWASAAIAYPEPVKAITQVAADGHQITFFPSDIKGLASLLWAYGNAPTRFIGARCNARNPATDENGRILDDACFNTNPGTWHIAVVNQLGISHRSMVMDATYDYEVWNYPIYGYSYTYFNPETMKQTDTPEPAIIPIEQYTRDKFKKYRSPNARHVIGVSMNTSYLIETLPSHRTGSEKALRSVRYVYDLELDGGGNILGGEWYTKMHPDFLWNAPAGTRVVSAADSYVNPASWNGEGKLPRNWAQAARLASPRSQPLAAIVEALVNKAK